TRSLVRREGGRPGRLADPRTQVADDGPLLHERVQGRMAAPIAYQTEGGERRTTLGGRDQRWDAGEGNLGGSRPRTAHARVGVHASGAEGPHGARRRPEAARDRAVDPRGDRAEPRPSRVPRRGVSDRRRPRGRADSAGGGGHRTKSTAPVYGIQVTSMARQTSQARPSTRRDQASGVASHPRPCRHRMWTRAIGTWLART